MTKRPDIITDPLTNKGTAFTHAERAKLGSVLRRGKVTRDDPGRSTKRTSL